MTDREKIIEMAKKCGILKRLTPLGTDEVWGNVSNLEAFYHAAQAEAFEQAAAVCEEGTALTSFQSKECYSYAHNRSAAIRALKEK
jgi:excinuclease UvrABC nuclease subunit